MGGGMACGWVGRTLKLAVTLGWDPRLASQDGTELEDR